MWQEARTRTVTITVAQQRFASWLADVLVYTIVLNLFVEHMDGIFIESFTISIFTAVVLKALLDLLTGVEHGVAAYFRAREGAIYRVLGALATFSILFFSKFVILEVIDIVFGDEVELHGFIEIVALIIGMIVARKLVDAAYAALGQTIRDVESPQ